MDDFSRRQYYCRGRIVIFFLAMRDRFHLLRSRLHTFDLNLDSMPMEFCVLRGDERGSGIEEVLIRAWGCFKGNVV